jgi:hypothetical protein
VIPVPCSEVAPYPWALSENLHEPIRALKRKINGVVQPVRQPVSGDAKRNKRRRISKRSNDWRNVSKI